MQITRFLGAGRSGFFTVDLKTTPEPCMVQERARRLAELSQEDQGIGITFSNISDELQDLWTVPWNVDFLHDRWPRYTHQRSDRLSITCQHFVSNGTVFVRTQYQATANPVSPVPLFSRMKLRPNDYHIRDLDFTDQDNSFNEFSSQQSHALGPHGCSVIFANNGFKPGTPGTNGHYHNAVCLISAITINGQLREFEKVEDRIGQHYRVRSKSVDDFTITPSQPLEIVEAYRLQLVPKVAHWKDFVIPFADFAMDDALSSSVFRKVSFSPDLRLDFITRRNLEHILSVCTVRVPLRLDSSGDMNVPHQQSQVERQTQEISSNAFAAALTCGDLSGHRLVTSASL